MKLIRKGTCPMLQSKKTFELICWDCCDFVVRFMGSFVKFSLGGCYRSVDILCYLDSDLKQQNVMKFKKI